MIGSRPGGQTQPGPQSAVPAPVFIVGSMGSGTTVMRLILDSHENIAIAQETTFLRTVLANKYVPFWKFGGVWYQRLGWDESEFDEQLRQFYGSLFERFAARQGKSRWGDKSPHHVWHMKTIADLWPDAVFIGIVRHPGAAASSIHNRFRFAWDDSVRHWKRFTTQMLLTGIEFGDRFVLCRYEDLVGDPEPLLRALLDWLGEPWSPAVLRHHVVQTERGGAAMAEGHTRVSDPLDPSRIGTWVSSMDEDRWQLLRRETDGLARYFGYEVDDPSQMQPLLGSGNQRRLVTGVDLAGRMTDFPSVDWNYRPKPSLQNRLLRPIELKRELERARKEGARSVSKSSRRSPRISTARSLARRGARWLARKSPVRGVGAVGTSQGGKPAWWVGVRRASSSKREKYEGLAAPTEVFATSWVPTARGFAVECRFHQPWRPAAVVLRLQDGRGEARLPVASTLEGAGFSFEVVPEAFGGPSLRDGLWDLFVELSSGGVRGLVRLSDERGPYESSTYVTPVLAAPGNYLQPYTTLEGYVSVRVRRATAHVEVLDVWVADGGLSLRGRVCGAAPRGAAELVLRASGREFVTPAAVTADTVSAEIESAAVVAALADGEEDVVARTALRLAGASDELPVAGWLDDIGDKRSVMRYPAASLEWGERVWSVRPEWDADNRFGVRLRGRHRESRADRTQGPLAQGRASRAFAVGHQCAPHRRESQPTDRVTPPGTR